MANKIGGLEASFEVYSSLKKAVLMQVNKENRPFAQERLGLLSKFNDVEDRISDIRSSITGIGMHVAHPPRRYMDYTSSKTQLSELQQRIYTERQCLNSLQEELSGLSIEGLAERIPLIKEELDNQQANCLKEIQNVERVIRNYRPKKTLDGLMHCLFR